jgi:hypothetical protein
MSDDYADRIAAVAVELVQRVRDDDPEDYGRWLRLTVAPEDMPALAVVLACAVPLDKPWGHLTAWARMPRSPRNDEAVQALTAERFAHVMPPDLPRSR